MAIRFIDTHVHLTWNTYSGRVDEVVARAREAGVAAMIDLGTDLSSSLKACDHARRHHDIYFAAGIHPNDAASAKDTDLDEIETLCRDPKCVAVGETGLDFYRNHTDPAIQEKWLRKQLQLAKRIGKPVVLHDRESSQRLLKVLEEEEFDGIEGPGGVFHCFAGGKEMAEEVLARGFHISFTGNLTYKNSNRPEVSVIVPLDRLLLETDSPFMAPVPRRGRENEPAYLPYIAEAHAVYRGMTLEEIARQTTANAVKLFKLNVPF